MSVPPGWYPDPERVNTLRYWTGAEWTDDRTPGVLPAPPRQMTTGTLVGLIVAGIVTAVMVALVVYAIIDY